MSFRPGNRERGWNDPPEFLHTEAQSNTSQKRTLLNQRVSHNLDNLNTNSISESENKLTEPPKSSAPPTSQQVNENKNDVVKQENSSDTIKTSEIFVQDLENIFNSKVQFLRNNELAKLKGRVCDDILKRVKIFVNNWPKLNDNVKLKMYYLTEALNKSELNTANDIHVRLMLDFPSEVSQWMVGIKKLIHELIENEKKKQASTEAEPEASNIS